MNVSPQRSIPPHLREDVFRSYEPLLTHAVRVWPTESIHGCPPDLSFATFSAGVRNAINSVLEFEWQTDLDIVKLREMRRSRAFVIAATSSNSVIFRAPGRKERGSYEIKSSTVETPSPVALPSSVVPARDMTAEQIRAFVVLLDAGLIAGPILIRGCVSLEIEALSQTANVFFTFDPDKNETILT